MNRVMVSLHTELIDSSVNKIEEPAPQVMRRTPSSHLNVVLSYIKIKRWEYMVVKPQHIYGSFTHSVERKQIKAKYTIKFQIQQKLKPYTLFNYKLSKT